MTGSAWLSEKSDGGGSHEHSLEYWPAFDLFSSDPSATNKPTGCSCMLIVELPLLFGNSKNQGESKSIKQGALLLTWHACRASKGKGKGKDEHRQTIGPHHNEVSQRVGVEGDVAPHKISYYHILIWRYPKPAAAAAAGLLHPLAAHMHDHTWGLAHTTMLYTHCIVFCDHTQS
jgi:hypothetical protein